jgi:hypothetical protein
MRLVILYKFLPPTTNEALKGREKLKPSKREIDGKLNRECRAHNTLKGFAAEEPTQALVLQMPSSCVVV